MLSVFWQDFFRKASPLFDEVPLFLALVFG